MAEPAGNKEKEMSEGKHGEGLAHDLRRMVALANRREVLRLLAGASLIPLIGCDEDGRGEADGGADGPSGCSAIPEETGGPYPGDGSNGPNVLNQSGVVRSDVRSSFGALTGTAAGVTMTLQLTVQNSKASCAPLAGYAVYAWHCTLDGKYSLYTEANQNYLRGVQETDASGVATFTSIFPGCYSGRWPHIHFEIFTSLANAMAGTGKVKTSQLALPSAACNEVYASSGYSASVSNFAAISLSSDNVFSDGAALETATAAGSAAGGYTVSLTLAV
jgi:protocatechuate 3,4-dioxygenase beta subunit